ncbi:hypothetical protein ACFYXQ_40210 [Nocardia jiangxiensis]|uniref:Uncharacterized protein n=1 Tax=Nocardia jiangxiensis TaxID=282685 RepID=A0ABW6SCF3_9NOCA
MRSKQFEEFHRRHRLLTRPVAVVVLAVSVGMSAVAHAAPTSCAPDAGSCPIAGVQLTYYPWTDTGYPGLGRSGLIAAPALLDAFAREYANRPHPTNTGAMTDRNPSAQDFFVWWLPNRLANIAMGTAQPPPESHLDMRTADGLGRAQWLVHLAGYYSSVWLRSNMRVFDRPVAISQTTPDAVYSQLYQQSLHQYRDAALTADPDAALTFAEHTLRSNVPASTEVPGPLGGLLELGPAEVGMFGYDATWLRYLVPPSANAPVAAKPLADNFFSADPNVLLDAHFALANQPFLSRAEERYRRATSAPETAARITGIIRGAPGTEPLIATQQRFTAAGTAIYRTGVPGTVSIYRGWNQDQYDRLLTWASYAVMYNKADSLNALTAVATSDARLARQEITAALLWWGYCLTYIAAIFDPHSDTQSMDSSLPHFTTAAAR